MHSKVPFLSFISSRHLHEDSHENISDTDDSSTASTSSIVSVNHYLKRPISAVTETTHHNNRKRKRVTFNLKRNEVVVTLITSLRDEAKSTTIMHDSWYNREDYKRFKHSTHGLARLISRTENKNNSENSFKRVLERAQVLCNRQSAAVSFAEERQLAFQRQNITRHHQQQQQHEVDDHDLTTTKLPQLTTVDGSTAVEWEDECRVMSQWVVDAVGRVGLERLAVRTLRNEAKMRRSLVLERVLKLQQLQKLKYMGIVNNNDGHDNEWMRRYCEQITRPSQLMAQFLARSQAEALLVEAT